MCINEKKENIVVLYSYLNNNKSRVRITGLIIVTPARPKPGRTRDNSSEREQSDYEKVCRLP